MAEAPANANWFTYFPKDYRWSSAICGMISSPGILSAIGTRGSLTMPHSMASISEKSLTVQGKSVPSAQPEPLRKNGVADRS